MNADEGCSPFAEQLVGLVLAGGDVNDVWLAELVAPQDRSESVWRRVARQARAGAAAGASLQVTRELILKDLSDRDLDYKPKSMSRFIECAYRNEKERLEFGSKPQSAHGK